MKARNKHTYCMQDGKLLILNTKVKTVPKVIKYTQQKPQCGIRTNQINEDLIRTSKHEEPKFQRGLKKKVMNQIPSSNPSEERLTNKPLTEQLATLKQK